MARTRLLDAVHAVAAGRRAVPSEVAERLAVLQKLGVDDRTGAVTVAIRRGVIRLP